MDQGIIQNINVQYRHLMVKRGLPPAVEKKILFQWSLLDALSPLKDAWSKVKPTTIANCYKHCGFVRQDPETQTADDDDYESEYDLPLPLLAANLCAIGADLDDEALHLFREVDDYVATSAALTDDGIIQEVQSSSEAKEKEKDEKEEQDTTVPPPTFA